MVKVSKDTVVYVVSPAYNKTGGTELAHQLVYTINKNGLEAKVAYYKDGEKPMQVNPAFRRYVDTFVAIQDIEDLDRNVVVLPETGVQYGKPLEKIQKCIWWMSVDNYTKWHHLATACEHFDLWTIIKWILRGRLKTSPYPHFDKAITHFYQSEYARVFLEKSGIDNACRLSDYLNEEYLRIDVNTERKDAVLYNPRKGMEFTQKLIKAAPDINWVPLQNMTTEQVKETLLHSKVYIDFGNHPGKDRFPREAAACGCCVITGKRGSAKFHEDVPIDDEFKFDEKKVSPKDIVAKIKQCLTDYRNQSKKFDGYRAYIKGEYETFQNDVKLIFGSGATYGEKE